MKESFEKFFQKLGFTPTERKVVLFLVGAFLLGIGIRFVQVSRSGGPGFDYSASDAEFAGKVSAPVPPGTGNPGTAGAGEKESTGAGTSSGMRVSGFIHVNRATKQELMSLPGIGETIAERIILFREDHGPFTALTDLMKVKGIGEKKFNRIAQFCTVEDN